jgi:hypothetical protein
MVRKFLNIIKVEPIEPLCRKPAYNSMEEAQDMIRYITENRVVKEIRPYKCNICGFWHLTSHQKK